MLTLEIRKPRWIQWCATNGFFHNLLIPAYTSWYKNGRKCCEVYYVNNEYHRDPTVGPAYTCRDSDGQKQSESYYVSGEWVSKAGCSSP
jgi:antitoxin component YwqK of YwqJK toxin-antitoxin module